MHGLTLSCPLMFPKRAAQNPHHSEGEERRRKVGGTEGRRETYGEEERDTAPLELGVDVHPPDAGLAHQVRVFFCGRRSFHARGAERHHVTGWVVHRRTCGRIGDDDDRRRGAGRGVRGRGC